MSFMLVLSAIVSVLAERSLDGAHKRRPGSSEKQKNSRNPNLVEEMFTRFSKPEQVFLYGRLVWGWGYVTSQDHIPPTRLKERTQRLKRLERRVKESE